MKDWSYFDKMGDEIWLPPAVEDRIFSKNFIIQTSIRNVQGFLDRAFNGGIISCGISDDVFYTKTYNVFKNFGVVEGVQVYDFSMTKWFRNFSMLLPRPVKDKVKEITNYEEARRENVLKSYFGKHDLFGICEGVNDNFNYSYANDYFAWFNRFYSIEDRVRYYRSWMSVCQDNLTTRDNSFSSPLSFVTKFENQIAQYVDIISNIVDDRELYVVGDGPGTASIACLMCNRKYFSYEPNGIGSIAVSIGLISSAAPSPDRKKNDVVLLFNVAQYMDVMQFQDSSVVIFSSSGEFGNFPLAKCLRPVVFRGHLYTTVSMNNSNGCRRETTNHGMVKEWLVDPQDQRTREMCRDEKITVSPKGKKVSFHPVVGSFSLVQREDPSDERAKVGSVKEIDDNLFTYYCKDQLVFFDDGMITYSPESYYSTHIANSFVEKEGYIYVSSISPDQINYVRDDSGALLKVFFIRTMVSDGRKIGVFRFVNSNFRTKEKLSVSSPSVGSILNLGNSKGLMMGLDKKKKENKKKMDHVVCSSDNVKTAIYKQRDVNLDSNKGKNVKFETLNFKKKYVKVKIFPEFVPEPGEIEIQSGFELEENKLKLDVETFTKIGIKVETEVIIGYDEFGEEN